MSNSATEISVEFEDRVLPLCHRIAACIALFCVLASSGLKTSCTCLSVQGQGGYQPRQHYRDGALQPALRGQYNGASW